MGRGQKRGRTQRKHFKENRENVWKYNNDDDKRAGGADSENKKQHSPWEPFNTENSAFDEYYKEQSIVSEEEWDKFISFLRTPLPAAFRINSSSQFYEDIQSQLENDFSKLPEGDLEHELGAKSIMPLPWYPGNLAWHSNFSRMQLRKTQTLERFHEFLKLENETGNITRQEAVSMVPPLFLDVLPDHHILDMCAAPGSKTFQLLEMMHQPSDVGLLPRGLVIANDVDVQRCNLLIHQTKRMCSANLIVTNHEAQNFPSCRFNQEKKYFKLCATEETMINQLLFDRVLCDVPCSGDGTLRKAPDIWRKWNSGMGNGLHRLQIQIAMRGLALLKVGGRMVYSTCSMNPVENEAVVAEILRRSGNSVELLDVSEGLPQLIRRQGLKTWKVKDKGVWLGAFEDVPSSRRGIIVESMFPPLQRSSDMPVEEEDEPRADTSVEFSSLTHNSKSETKAHEHLPLERCMRIVPHDQNTGAFFIAVLQKLAPLQGNSENNPPQQKKKPAESASEEIAKGDSQSEQNLSEAKSGNLASCMSQNERKWKGIDPVVLFEDEHVIKAIRTFYGIDESFPLEGHLVTRNFDLNHVKRIYYLSTSAINTVKLNFMADQALKITSLGLKIFERQTSKEAYADSSCAFRISSEGLPLLLPYIKKQILYSSLADFDNLLKNRSVKLSDFIDSDMAQKASDLMPGCCVVVLNNGDQAVENFIVDASTVAIGCWKGKASLSVMVSETDSKELLGRLSYKFEGINGVEFTTNIGNTEDVDEAAQVIEYDEEEKTDDRA
ncbi:uncharacterized protein LOC144713481 [Wolffia australiana]